MPDQIFLDAWQDIAITKIEGLSAAELVSSIQSFSNFRIVPREDFLKAWQDTARTKALYNEYDVDYLIGLFSALGIEAQDGFF